MWTRTIEFIVGISEPYLVSNVARQNAETAHAGRLSLLPNAAHTRVPMETLMVKNKSIARASMASITRLQQKITVGG